VISVATPTLAAAASEASRSGVRAIQVRSRGGFER